MKLSFFLNQSLESPSGIGRYWPLAKELTKRGHKVSIIALHHNLKALDKKSFVKDGVRVSYVGQMLVRKVGSRKYYYNKIKLVQVFLNSVIKMFVKGLSSDEDVICLFKPQPVNGLPAVMLKFLKRKPLVLDCDDYEAEAVKLTGLQKKIFILFEDNIPKIADVITANTRFIEKRNKRVTKSRKRIFYIPNGVEEERFNKINNKKIEKLKKKLKLKNKKVIIYFGSISASSGHPLNLLIEAFKIVNKRIKNSVLLIVGGGPDLPELMKRIKEGKIRNIILTKHVAPEDVPEYVKLAHVSVDPVYDNLACRARSPLKIFESMILGVPVVSSDVGDRKVIIGKAGLLAETKPESLASAMIKILSNANMAKSMSKEAKKIAKKYYWSRLADSFEMALVSALKGKV